MQVLLRKGGLLIANELTAKTDFLTLTFGLTDGWWLYDDPQWRMPGAWHVQVFSTHEISEQSQAWAMMSIICLR